jgi:DNA-binding MarR family transcriptional regulator
MTRARQPEPADAPSDDEVAWRRGLELVFYTHMEMAAVADAVLAEHGLSRSHHRILYLAARHPGITVNDILSILRVTNQGLARPLKELVAQDLVVQRLDAADRRRRGHFVTPKGMRLYDRVAQAQFGMIAAAYDRVSPGDLQGFWRTLEAMMRPEDRRWVSDLLPG